MKNQEWLRVWVLVSLFAAVTAMPDEEYVQVQYVISSPGHGLGEGALYCERSYHGSWC